MQWSKPHATSFSARCYESEYPRLAVAPNYQVQVPTVSMTAVLEVL